MIYDFSQHNDRENAFNKIQRFLLDKTAVVDITEKQQGKTVSQNSYLHVLIDLFAIEIGETRQYIKQYVYKQIVNKEAFKVEYENTKKGYKRVDWLSVRDMDKEQTTTQIERFRNFASTKGVYLPSSEEYKANKVSIDKEIQNFKEYL